MLGALLKALRGERTAEEVATSLGVARSTIYLWESTNPDPDLHRLPRPEYLAALLDLYGATAEQRAEAWELRSKKSQPAQGAA